jgi:hypothetical protein
VTAPSVSDDGFLQDGMGKSSNDSRTSELEITTADQTTGVGSVPHVYRYSHLVDVQGMRIRMRLPRHVASRAILRSRQHPVDSLITTLEETARVLWRSLDAHMDQPLVTGEWSKDASELHQRCLACDERLQMLKTMRDKARGIPE